MRFSFYSSHYVGRVELRVHRIIFRVPVKESFVENSIRLKRWNWTIVLRLDPCRDVAHGQLTEASDDWLFKMDLVHICWSWGDCVNVKVRTISCSSNSVIWGFTRGIFKGRIWQEWSREYLQKANSLGTNVTKYVEELCEEKYKTLLEETEEELNNGNIIALYISVTTTLLITSYRCLGLTQQRHLPLSSLWSLTCWPLVYKQLGTGWVFN